MTRIFLSTWGQNDNIGDSILRRGLLRTFQQIPGVELHVHAGRRESSDPNDEGYLTALGLRGDEVLYDRSIDWLGAASMSVLARRTILALPAGEIVYGKIGKHFMAAGNLALALAPRIRGGATLQVGAGVRMSAGGDNVRRAAARAAAPRSMSGLERVSRRAMAMVAWRDAATQNAFGVGEVVPDWAFGEGVDPTTDGLGAAPAQRKLLAVTTRAHHGPLTADKVEQLRRLAARHDLTLQVYSQVRRDDEHVARLAQVLHPGTGALLFGDKSHAECEREVRALHRQSAVVAGDRAHALIIAATEGAIPVPLSNGTTEKSVRTVRAGGIPVPLDADSSFRSIEDYVGTQLADPLAIERPITVARQQIAQARARLHAIVDNTDNTGNAPVEPALAGR